MTLNKILEQIGLFVTSEETSSAVTSTKGVIEGVLFSPSLHEFLLPLKMVMIFWSILFALGILYFLKTSKRFETLYWSDFREFLMFKPANMVKRNSDWKKIKTKLSSPLQPEWKLAILEGFEMMEECLNESSSKDEFEDMVKSLSDKIGPVYEDILKDYEMQQSIITNPNFEINKDQAGLIMDHIEQGLKNLKWI